MRVPRQADLLVLMAFVWLAVFFGLYGFFVQTSLGRGWDERLFTAVPRQHSIWFRLSGALLGGEIVLGVVGVGCALVVGVRRRRFRQLLMGLLLGGVSLGLGELLKHVLLTRPSAGPGAAFGNSFPSGHTVVATSVVVAVWFVAGERWRPALVVLGGALCVLVGVATVVQQWHRPSDVVSAYALVAACACAARAMLLRWPGPSGTRPPQQAPH